MSRLLRPLWPLSIKNDSLGSAVAIITLAVEKNIAFRILLVAWKSVESLELLCIVSPRLHKENNSVGASEKGMR